MRIKNLPFVAVLVTAIGPSARGQGIDAILATVKADNAWTVEQQRSICEIPAPPFKEAVRAAEVKRRFDALGLRNVHIDSIGNVLGERPGSGKGPTIVLAGHLDTVFPEGTDVKVKVDGGRMSGPGIGDDCRGLAVMLSVARAYQRSNPGHDARIIFVADVGEEGAGNWRGVRHLYAKELKGKIDYFISIDGTGTGLASRGVGSNRYRVTYKGPGGHSYGAFGIPNPIHAMGRAIATISEIQVPSDPKTTFNVGVVSGGTSINSISASATMEIDMRSEENGPLNAVNDAIQRAVADALAGENARWKSNAAQRAQLTLVIDTIGLRPAGAQPDSARLVRTALDAAKALGFTTTTSSGSTDANVPIMLGVPGITIDGGGRGGNSHALSEWYEDGPNGWLGPQWAALIVARLAGLDLPRP